MALNGNMGLGFVFTAKDLASRAFDKIRDSFKSMAERVGLDTKTLEGSFTSLKRGMAVLAVGAAAVFGSITAANVAGELEQGIAKVGAVAGATTAQMQQLHDAALDVGQEGLFQPEEAAKGLEELAAMGFNATESVTALRPALDLAAGGSISVAEATSAMSSALKVFSLDVSEAGLVADKMLKVSNATALSASDLQMAMGTIGRGASVARQSLDEMLPSMGLVKNTGVDVSVAASSVSSALLELGKNADKFKKLGVSVQDAKGQFRPFMDVIMDTDKAMAGLTDTERVDKATDLFGRFGLTAFSAISTQLKAGIKDASGQILKGADALAFLRQQMASAGGAAGEFKDRIFDTFEGQKTVLANRFHTLAVVIGEPFAQVLKPVVKGISWLLDSLIGLVRSIPEPVKRFAAGLIFGLGVLLSVIGAVLVGKVVFTLLIIVIKAAAAAISGFVVAALPFIAVAALLVGAAFAIYKAMGGMGGLGDMMAAVWKKITLAYQALVQVFRDGGFSGAVMDELNKADNMGLKQFVIRFYEFAYRVQRFWEGLSRGFSAAYETYIKPAVASLSDSWDHLKESFGNLGRTFSKTFGTMTTSINNTLPASQGFNDAGESMGVTIGKIVAGVTVMVDWFVKFLDILTQVVEAITTVFDKVGTFIGEGAADAFLTVTDPFGTAERKFDGMIHHDQVQTIEYRNQKNEQMRRAAEQEAGRAAQRDWNAPALSASPAVAQAEVTMMSAPAGPQVSSEDIGKAVGDAVDKAMAKQRAQAIVLKVDGQTLASSVSDANSAAAAASFTPVPVF